MSGARNGIRGGGVSFRGNPALIYRRKNHDD